jgi:hypothetical protein
MIKFIFKVKKVIKYENLNEPLNQEIKKLKECVICLGDFKKKDKCKSILLWKTYFSFKMFIRLA